MSDEDTFTKLEILEALGYKTPAENSSHITHAQVINHLHRIRDMRKASERILEEIRALDRSIDFAREQFVSDLEDIKLELQRWIQKGMNDAD